MGKRSLPPTRFSLRRALRFEPFEVIVAGVGLLLLLVVAGCVHAESSARNRLQQEGRCLSALVVESGGRDSRLLHRSAAVRYELDGRTLQRALRYTGGRLRVGGTVRICVDPADPRSFFTAGSLVDSDGGGLIGRSTGWWALGIGSGVCFGSGLLLLLLVIGRHPWRFPVEES